MAIIPSTPVPEIIGLASSISIMRFILFLSSLLALESAWSEEFPNLYVESGIHHSARAVAFSQNGRFVATGSLDRTIKIWDFRSSRELFTLPNNAMSRFLLFLPGNEILASSNEDGNITIWNLHKRKLITSLECSISNPSIALSDSGKVLNCTDEKKNSIRRWDTSTFNEIQALSLGINRFTRWTLSANGSLMAGRDANGYTQIIGIASSNLIGVLPNETPFSAEIFSFAPKGTRVAVANAASVKIWQWLPKNKGFVLHKTIDLVNIHSIIFDENERFLACASETGDIIILETSNWKEVSRLTSYSNRIENAGLNPDSSLLIAEIWYDKQITWDLKTGIYIGKKKAVREELDTLKAKGSVNGKPVAVINGQNYVRLETPEGKEICTLVFLDKEDRWVVITPDGRFDTNIDLDNVIGLHWILSSNHFNALPLEIFMRDYYEPRLLPRVLAGEKFSDLPRLDQLNRAQPKVEIKTIEVEDAQSGLITVTVEVTNSTLEIHRDGKPVTMQSGAYDLRLFRDGQLVAQRPETSEAAGPGGQTREQELASWRRAHEIVELDSKTGKKTVTFSGIRLPRKAGLTDVEFSAYAFNSDRVKSETTPPTKFEVPKEVSFRQARAYVLTIGVNEFQGEAMNPLSFAANDAKELSAELGSRLKVLKDTKTGKLLLGDKNVISIPLVTELGTGNQKNELINYATKDRIKAVIEKLAGKPVDEARLAGAPNADQLQPSTPDDLVFIAFSTHGDTDKQGQFYLMPYDLGESKAEADIRRNAISSEELSAWLRTLDAAELVMIVDACHSAATVASKEFKPGPMGSRGLGQLAFDKRMRILAASQSDQAALETDKTKHGLLSYALVSEGLKENAADGNKDKRILLSEWLNYGAQRVPGLYQDYRDGKLKPRAATPLDAPTGKHFISIQQPALFDFARGRETFISE